ncbi:MAG: HD domain-containing protein [Melioribacteraceae bacterium]|nr:HD domain-containing protein [Melioribacteraceae bacterium]
MDVEPLKIKEEFIQAKNQIFGDEELLKNSLQFSIKYSLLVEEYVQTVLKGKKLDFAIASVGSFSRRELSPYSDIDMMFISEKVKNDEKLIKECVTMLWDAGIEASHTVREYSDIKRFLEEDLQAFTQFFETRFIQGNEKIYWQWNKKVFDSLNDKHKNRLLQEYFSDTKARHQKYGDSAKVLEPNIKFTAGGLRDLQIIEWIYAIKNGMILNNQEEISQTQFFLNQIKQDGIVIPRAAARLLDSYETLLFARNHVHLLSKHKNDRLEYSFQEKIGHFCGYAGNNWQNFMKKYFEAANIIKRFSGTMLKRFEEEVDSKISDILTIDLDDDFSMKNSIISYKGKDDLNLSTILRAFYYRGLHDARLDETLRSAIIEKVIDIEEEHTVEHTSSVFFREILRLPRNVGKTLMVMNELNVLSAFMKEWKDLIGFFQPGVYHCYTADEHTLIALNNLEKLSGQNNVLGKLFDQIKEKDVLFLSVLFHDIAKPISISGHEIIGGEIANTIMERLGYGFEEIEKVQFLVHHHLTMEQVAFRRNLNDPSTLNNFASIFPDSNHLDLLYLLTYSDLSAVSQVVWTQWKSELLNELYRKTKSMLEDRITGQELLSSNIQEIISGSEIYSENVFREHIESINDLGYLHHFTPEEINQHIDEIEKGTPISVLFKEDGDFTSVTVITRDSDALLSKLCGALAINDLNIHDAKIFTRKDGIVIDSFNVTDFRSGGNVSKERFGKIERDLALAVANELQMINEFNKIKSKWWRLENKLFKRKGKIKIVFEKHEKYTIIDVYSPDRLGLLYQVTKKMHDVGLTIYFAKINTKADDVVDSFYTLDRNGKKISRNDFQLITHELTQTIEEML